MSNDKHIRINKIHWDNKIQVRSTNVIAAYHDLIAIDPPKEHLKTLLATLKHLSIQYLAEETEEELFDIVREFNDT